MRTFHASGMNGGLALAETSDDGFVGTGQHQSSGAGNCDVYVYKVDGCGNPEWFKTFGGAGDDGGKSVQQTADGGYIVTGLIHLGAGDYDMMLQKLDAQGNQQWAKVYGGGGPDYGLYAQQTSDGGYIFTGFMSGLGFGAEDVALIKTDANGNTQWMKVYGGAASDWGSYVEQTSDGGYKIVGYTTSFGAGAFDIYVLKVDVSGTLQWAKTYGGASGEGSSQWGISGKITSDGGMMMCANTTSYGQGGNDYLLIKTDSLGAVLWAKTYGGTAEEQPRFALETDDKGFAIFGYTTSFGAGDLDAYLVKTDSLGALKWSKAYGGAAYDKGSMAREASDGGYALSIVTASFGADYYDPMFMKTDSLGNSGCNDVNAATVVQNITLSVGNGGSQMVPAASESVPALIPGTFTPNDVFLCQHCSTIPTFVPSDTSVCVNDSVYFYNTTSVGKRCNEDWFVNNTLVSGDKDTLVFAFSTPGVHQIQLIAKCGNSTDTNSIYINVYSHPTAAFSSTQVCRLSPSVFTDGSSPASGTLTSWDWNYGDSSSNGSVQNPSHIYPLTGAYNATLIVQNSYGCADTVTHPLSFYDLPIANFGTAPVCKSTAASFHDSSTVATGSITAWAWDFGDGSVVNSTQHPTHLFATAGTYTVTLVVTTNNSCKDTMAKSIVIHALPSVIFSTNNVCNHKTANFVDFSGVPATDTIQSWVWNFADGSPLLNNHQVTGGHLYADTGAYHVKLIVTTNFGCIDSTMQTLYVRPNPDAYFKNTTVCNGSNTVFTDSSTTATGTISLWKWDYSDGSNPVYTQSPLHQYVNAGIHPVTLIVQNTYGCADTVTKNVKVYFNPIANFTHQDVCVKDSMYFINTSSVDTSSSLGSYFWLFGDGGTSTLKSPAHYYAQSGTYHVTLLVKTVDSCSNAITKDVHVYDPPTAVFSISDVCLVDSAHFINSSTNPLVGTIANWSWDFGDASPQNTTVTSPHHLYNTPGKYEINLITQSSYLGCADTAKDSITVFPMPYAAFSISDVCFGNASNFTDLSTVITTDTVKTWNWDFASGAAFSSVQNPTRTFTGFGVYAVTLIATTNNGCSDTVINTTIIHPKPAVNFTTHNVCLTDIASFVDASGIPANTSNDVLAAWSWNFGDNSSANNNQNSTHYYDTTGVFNVQLKVTTDFGCSDSIAKSIKINPKPVVDFTVNISDGCEPLCVQLHDSSSIESGANVQWVWNAGDGTSNISGSQINHCFGNDSVTAANYYDITLTVTSDSGCVTTAVKPNYITVFPLPDAAFVVNPQSVSIVNPIISITDLSVGTTSWIWNWGDTDSTIIASQPLPHTYADTGSYVISLHTSSAHGCLDSAYQTVTIEPNFLFYIPSSFSPNDDGVNDVFSTKGIFVKEFEMSIFDRWGNLVFHSDSVDKPWDGKANKSGVLAQQDVFVYVIKVTNFKLEKYTYKGLVTLIR